MSYSKNALDIALARLEERKNYNKHIAERRHSEVCKAIPEYARLELSLADTMTRSIAALADKRANSESIIAKALEENANIQQKMTQLLVKNKFSENYMDPIYSCEKCRDSGNVDGQWCECFTMLLNTASAEELNASSPLELSTFESFDLSLYSDEYDKNIEESQREVMKKNFSDCFEFAENFNRGSKNRGLLMLGDTGLGKTHLSLAIANTVIKKGFSVVYNSAPELMRKLNKEYYGKSDADTMPLITTCDLLILDDLGAEMKSEQNISMLYEIVNARHNRQIPMIANSNLSIDEMRERYQDRVVSRLLSLRTLIFYGSDNRLKIIDN